MNNPYSTIEELMADPVPRQVWVVSYTISMGRNMWLAIHGGEFVDRIEVLAKFCRYWRGPLEGGPWRLALEVLKPSSEDWERELRLFDRDGGFELICGSLKFASMRDTTGVELNGGSR